jgi:AP endonuclease-1
MNNSGHLGIGAFRNIMNDPRVQNIPLILETPSFEQPMEVWGKEIAMLQRLSSVVREIPENKAAIESIIQTDDQLVAVNKNFLEKFNGLKNENRITKRRGGRTDHVEDADDGESQQ